jgi:DUF1365 family protein
MHARVAPAANVFRYRVCFYVLDLDELPALDRQLRLFGWNRPAVVGYRDSDHIDVRSLVDADRVLLLTNLRVLGYVFNPVSFFYCYRGGELTSVVAEVSNTFGERLPYVLTPDSVHEKRLHVSPFFGLDQEYRWQLSEPGDRVSVRIDVTEDGGRPFWATLTGRREELTNASLARALVRYPLMPQQVISLIHLQAARLWLKRVPFHHKPPFVPGVGSVKA